VELKNPDQVAAKFSEITSEHFLDKSCPVVLLFEALRQKGWKLGRLCSLAHHHRETDITKNLEALLQLDAIFASGVQELPVGQCNALYTCMCSAELGPSRASIPKSLPARIYSDILESGQVTHCLEKHQEEVLRHQAEAEESCQSRILTRFQQ
jgi:hypothetical protein